jgi:hypothetical protein
MKCIRNLLLFLTATMLVALSPLSQAAPAKQWSVASSAITSFGPSTITLTITNETPNGNSNINSLVINLPSGISIDTSQATPVSSAWIGQLSYKSGSGGSISMSNMSPLKPKSSFQITAAVIVDSSLGCGQAVPWPLGQAFTGSSFSGDTFSELSTPTTTIPTNPTLAFVSGPSNVAIGSPVSVTIKATSCSSGASGVNVTVTVTDSQGNVLGTVGGTTGADGTVIVTVPTGTNQIIATTGTYTITAGAPSYATISSPVTVFAGELDCQPQPPFEFGMVNGDPNQSGYAAGSRGFWNKDGMSCVPLLYTFENYILSTDPNLANKVHLIWDTTAGQNPAFTYSITWKAEDVDNPANPNSLGPSNYGFPVPLRVFVAFNTTGTPQFVPALSCSSTTLPAPYGNLHASIGTSDAQILVDVPASPIPTYTDSHGNTVPYPTSTFPTSGSFPIVIGTERMLVTAISGASSPFTLTVTRGDGATQKAAHDANVYVMSTPLPIDPNTQVQIPMCIVNNGWMAAGLNPTTGIPQVRWFTTVFDIGDGWTLGR